MVKNLKTRILRFLLLIKPVRYLLYNYKNFKKLRVFNNLDLKTDSLFIDFGANEGIVSQYIFDKYKCNIVAYEPHPACEEILKKKFKNNKKVKLFFGAVTDTSIDNKLYFHKKNKNLMDLNYSQAASLEVNKQNIDKNNYITIKSYNISEILNSFESIDCLKIDIEGYEYKILPEIINKIKRLKKFFVNCMASQVLEKMII